MRSVAMNKLSLKQLAEKVDETGTDAGRRLVANQVQHWTNKALLSYVGFDPTDHAVGRGKIRRYPEDLVPFCRLLHWLAANESTSGFMQIAMARIKAEREDAKQPGKLDRIAHAISGDVPFVWMVVSLPVGPINVQTYPVSPDPMGEGALLLNLTRIFYGPKA